MCVAEVIYVLHYALHSISPVACGCLLCDIVEAGNRGDKVLQNFISSRDQWTCKKYEQGRDKNTQEDYLTTEQWQKRVRRRLPYACYVWSRCKVVLNCLSFLSIIV